jgi:hypothetical protein
MALPLKTGSLQSILTRSVKKVVVGASGENGICAARIVSSAEKSP